MEITKHFAYLDTLLMRVLDMKLAPEWLIDEYNLSGSRYSGKTTSLTIEFDKVFAAALYKDKKVALYAFRYLTRQVKELVEEIRIALDERGLEYKFTKQDNKFVFANGSFIVVSGVYSPTGRINLKGLAKCYNFDFAFRWVEEANELSTADFQAIDFAIRGAKKTIRVSSCNPDMLYQDHIKYLNDRSTFKFELMSKQNQQLVIKNDNGFRKLFHYSNWKVNPHLSFDIVKKLEELKKLDPIKAMPWYYGMPGALQGSIFGFYLENKATKLDFKATNYVGGLDLGYAESPNGHPTFGVLVALNEQASRYHVVGEYYHLNATMQHKTPQQLAVDIVNFYWQQYTKLNIKGTLTISVDYGAGGLVFIDNLKAIVRNQGLQQWINFEAVDKELWFVKDRVEAIQTLLANKKLSWDNSVCPNLTESMSLMKYKEVKNKETYKIDIVDLNDDGFDALSYAIMKYIKQTIDNLRQSVILSKRLQREGLF